MSECQPLLDSSWITTFHPCHPPRLGIAAGCWRGGRHNITDRKPPIHSLIHSTGLIHSHPAPKHSDGPIHSAGLVHSTGPIHFSTGNCFAFHLSFHSLLWMQIMVHSTTSVFCVSILQKWTLSNRCPMNIWPRFMMMTPFPCPAILSFPALLQLRQLATCLVIWGLSERVPSNVYCASQCPLCHCASHCTS